MRRSLRPIAVLFVLGGFGCGSDDPVAGPAPPASVTSVTLTGNTNLTALGQSSQLTLTANYSDGTSRDVTSEATWLSNNPSVATVSAGVVTAVTFGMVNISGSFQSRGATAGITAMPTGTFILNGRVREPGGGSLGNVLVLERLSNTTKQTNGSGNFQFVGLPAARFRIELANYERLDLDVNPDPAGSRAVSVDAPIQRVIRVAAGQSSGPQFVAPNDVAHAVGADLCNPCKLIRVATGGPMGLTVRVTWTGLPGAVHLWANGQRYSASSGSSITASVQAGSGDALLYVGWMLPLDRGASDYVNFTLSTTIE